MSIAQQLGEVLKNARLDRSLTIEEVSRVLSLRPAFIVAMETGDYQEIGALLYAKNYLRKYAKFLGVLDENFEAQLAQLTDSLENKNQGYYHSVKIKQEAAEKQRSNHFKYYLLFVLLLLAIFAYLYQNGMIPAIFREMRFEMRESNDNVSLLNERFPSIELEYGIASNKEASVESVRENQVDFETLLIDTIEEQQSQMQFEPISYKASNQTESDALKAPTVEENDNHVGKKERLVQNHDLKSGIDQRDTDQRDANQRVKVEQEQQLDNLKSSNYLDEQRGTGRFNALGQALQHYDKLLIGRELPVINMGSSQVTQTFIAPSEHLLYRYYQPNASYYGIAVAPVINEKLKMRADGVISYFDRESGFYPALNQLAIQFELIRAEEKLIKAQQAIEQQEIAITEARAQGASETTLEIMDLELQKLEAGLEQFEKSMAILEDQLPQKMVVNIIAEDITTLDITDHNGRIVTSRVMAPGDSYQLEGLGIYDIYLGDPQMIDKITVNGQAIPEYHYKPAVDEVVSVHFSLDSAQYQ